MGQHIPKLQCTAATRSSQAMKPAQLYTSMNNSVVQKVLLSTRRQWICDDARQSFHASHPRRQAVLCRNKEQNTNKDSFSNFRVVRLCSGYICQHLVPLPVAPITLSTTTLGRSKLLIHPQSINSQPRTQSSYTESMPSHHMHEKNKISKANRSRTRLIDRRFAKKNKMQLKTTKPLSMRNPELANKISEMRLTIAPIVHVVSGIPAPDFPSTMLSLFTLTEDQLDSLAAYYSQSHTPTDLTYRYPQTMDWNKPFLDKDAALAEDCKLSELERLKVKMRMFARFIGMRGAETPQWEYERQVEILGNKIGRSVREEEEETLMNKAYRGPNVRY